MSVAVRGSHPGGTWEAGSRAAKLNRQRTVVTSN